MNRLVGLETEYGCLTGDPTGPQPVVARVSEWAFERHRMGLRDVHQRDPNEPAGNGGFLFNGGRLYVDMGHLEYCTPECSTLRQILAYDRAGDAILLRALKELGLQGRVGFIRNNIDHWTGATFGCHENYLLRRDAPLTKANTSSLLAFLTLRMLYTGAGRVGFTPGADKRGDLRRPGSPSLFQVSQRADYINTEMFEWVQFNRSIINTKDEPLADPGRFRRLHLLHGDTSVLPFGLLLKVGTTSLVLDLLELDALPRVALADPVATFHALSHQPQAGWLVRLESGSVADALELLSLFRDTAASEFRGRDEETDAVLDHWATTITSLARAQDELVGKIDWVTKHWLFGKFVETEHVSWTDPWMRAQDIEFHQIDPARSLALPLEATPPGWGPDARDVEAAMRTPPPDTRARIRSWIMECLGRHHIDYRVDWESVAAEGQPPLLLPDPRCPAPPEAESWARRLHLID